ncbi:MAG: TonB-dependent receptor, partial [Bacteroidota bacterium]|nr:TonB-dependent receptor [Bacteroidota bacterium]
NYKFWENFTANLRIGNDHYNDRRKIRIAYGTNGTPYGSYQETAYALNENNVELTLDYNKKLSDDFALDILAGGNLQSNYYESNDQKAPKLAVSGLYTLNNSRDPLVSSSYYSQQKKNSVFSSGQLSFRNYAFLNVTARNDWSSTLPVQNNSYFYPSVNASVILSDALDIKSDALSYLKVRGGWSKVGKDSDPYLLVNTYPFNTPFGSNPLLTVNDKSLNSKLKPETTSSSEVGTEIGLFNNRVKVDLSYYNTNSYNQILNLDVSPSTGYNSKLLNAGKINNRGFEAQLNVTPVSTNGFKWDVTANFATNRSKVLKLDDAGLLQSYRIDTYDVDIVAPIGQKYGTLLGTAYLRNDKGQIVVDANGIPEADSNRKSLGSFQPKWTGGVTNTFSYKGVTLSFLVDAKVGGSLYSGSYATGLYTGVLAQTLPGRDAEHGGLAYYYSGNNKSTSPVQLIGSASVPNGETVYHDGIIFKGVTESGAANTAILPAEQYYKALYGIDEHNVFSSTYVKLRELTLGFALPSRWTSKLGASSASLSFIGRNLWIIHKNVPNIDPETALNTGNGQGQEDLTLPTTRSLGFSLRLNF